MIVEVAPGSWHATRYGEHTHQCRGHMEHMRRMRCLMCSLPGDCAHLHFEPCHCFPSHGCDECLFELEDKEWPWSRIRRLAVPA